jgi:hypothetical protein
MLIFEMLLLTDDGFDFVFALLSQLRSSARLDQYPIVA